MESKIKTIARVKVINEFNMTEMPNLKLNEV